MEEVWHLVYVAYLRSGYITPREDEQFRSYPEIEELEETTVLVALEENEVVGTVTVTLDSKLGLTTDINFPIETERIRLEGLPIACAWRLAAKENVTVAYGVNQALMAGALEILRGNVLLLECHPRHVMYYMRRLKMRMEVGKKTTAGLLNAPSVLMVSSPETYDFKLKE
jgi:hypothetical protein